MSADHVPPDADYRHSISAECLARLRSFEHCGHRVTPEALDVARFLAVVPTGTGGIQIEWHCFGWDVEVEVDSAGEFVSVFAERAEQQERSG